MSDASVVVYADGSPLILASRATDAEGVATIDKLPAAFVDVRIFPPAGGGMARDSLLHQPVPAGDTLKVTVAQ